MTEAEIQEALDSESRKSRKSRKSRTSGAFGTGGPTFDAIFNGLCDMLAAARVEVRFLALPQNEFLLLAHELRLNDPTARRRICNGPYLSGPFGSQQTFHEVQVGDAFELIAPYGSVKIINADRKSS